MDINELETRLVLQSLILGKLKNLKSSKADICIGENDVKNANKDQEYEAELAKMKKINNDVEMARHDLENIDQEYQDLNTKIEEYKSEIANQEKLNNEKGEQVIEFQNVLNDAIKFNDAIMSEYKSTFD
jgi:predicted  nucleic acid-binding Zn-ribbon protein